MIIRSFVKTNRVSVTLNVNLQLNLFQHLWFMLWRRIKLLSHFKNHFVIVPQFIKKWIFLSPWNHVRVLTFLHIMQMISDLETFNRKPKLNSFLASRVFFKTLCRQIKMSFSNSYFSDSMTGKTLYSGSNFHISNFPEIRSKPPDSMFSSEH